PRARSPGASRGPPKSASRARRTARAQRPPNVATSLDSAAAMRPQPLISVTDVPRSSRWYQNLLGCESGHGGEEYERLVRDGRLVLQLHHFAVEHHHGRIGDPELRPYGNGVALWFEIDDSTPLSVAPRRSTLRSRSRRTATRPRAHAGRRIARSGCVI